MIRCGVDIVEIERFERFLANADEDQLRTVFSEAEMEYCNAKATRTQSLAARFAVKEACLKLFPQELALKSIDFGDFEVEIDNWGAPSVSRPGARTDPCSPRPTACG